jgi:hypothetical protein
MPVSPTLVDCLMRERQALEEARPVSQDDVVQTICTLAAWMQWALVIDDVLEKLKTRAYVLQRAADPGGRALMGVRYAWERLKHQGDRLDDLLLTEILPDAVTVVAGRHPPVSRIIRPPSWEARWKDFADLPAPDPWFVEKDPAKPKENGYKQHLSGAPVVASTASAQSFLLRVT